jgi:long-subunit acyl-CoA synthetase (AMP-forming)
LYQSNPITGDLILTGRAKDTIVLSNGETIEAQPLEDAILSGSVGLFEQVMLTGMAADTDEAGLFSDLTDFSLPL